MGSSAHATALSEKHKRLDAELEVERAKLHADAVQIQRLKREKLKIKDEISRKGYEST